MNKLIKGGMYTRPEFDNIYFVYIEEKEIHGFMQSYFFAIETDKYNNQKELIMFIYELIKKSNHLFWRDKLIHLRTDIFLEKYDGFIGCINDELLTYLNTVLKNISENQN